MAITIKNGAKVLYQWERGVALTVTSPCDVLRVSREEEQRSVDLYPTWSGDAGTVLIPDRMLTESGYLRAARIDKGDGEERVVESVRFIVRAAQKPEDIASSKQEIRDWEELRLRMAALERAARDGKFNGDDGVTPHVGENGNWYLGEKDTGVNAEGDDGVTPHIGENGNWYLGETDTGVKATGNDGITPHIGENGNWFVGERDTNVKATGNNGITPHIGKNGNWYIGDTDTGIKASGIHIGTEPPTSGETVWIDTDEEPEENDSTQIDVIAQPGQIIAVKEVDANGKPTKWEAIDLPKAKEPETPDFSANEGDAGYIKNRTHYVDEKGVIHKLPNMYIDAEWMATKEDGGAGNTVFIPEQTVTGLEDVGGNTIQTALVAGDVYAVEVNGVLYRCECYSYDGLLCLGNGTLIGGTGGSNEPFCVTWTGGTAQRFLFYNDGTLESPIGIKVSDWLDDIYNKLPKEFLPPVSWNNLTDRPVVDGAGEAFLTYTTTFATDTAAKNGAKLPNSLTNTLLWLDVNGELVKVQRQQSGMVMEWYDEDGNKWVSSSLGGVYVYAKTAGTYTYTMYAPADTPMFDPQYLPPNLAKKADIPKSGGGTGGTSIDVTAEVGQTIVVKEIDANGKPTKWESADYQPRTHWSEDGKVQVSTWSKYLSEFNSEYGFYTIIPWFNEHVDSYPLTTVHSIEYDGVEYKNLATFELDGTRFFGNLYFLNDLFGTSFGNTGEPFVLTGNQYGMELFTLDQEKTEHSVQIYVDGTYRHRIEQCYVPKIPIVDLTPYYTEIESQKRLKITGDDHFEKVYEVLRKNEIVRIVYRLSNGSFAMGCGFPMRVQGTSNIYVHCVGLQNGYINLNVDATRDYSYIEEVK